MSRVKKFFALLAVNHKIRSLEARIDACSGVRIPSALLGSSVDFYTGSVGRHHHQSDEEKALRRRLLEALDDRDRIKQQA